MVAREDYDIFGIVAVNEADILVNRVCGTGVPSLAGSGFVRRENVYSAVRAVETPRLTVAYVLVEDERLILRENADGVDTGVNAV